MRLKTKNFDYALEAGLRPRKEFMGIGGRYSDGEPYVVTISKKLDQEEKRQLLEKLTTSVAPGTDVAFAGLTNPVELTQVSMR